MRFKELENGGSTVHVYGNAGMVEIWKCQYGGNIQQKRQDLWDYNEMLDHGNMVMLRRREGNTETLGWREYRNVGMEGIVRMEGVQKRQDGGNIETLGRREYRNVGMGREYINVYTEENRNSFYIRHLHDLIVDDTMANRTYENHKNSFEVSEQRSVNFMYSMTVTAETLYGIEYQFSTFFIKEKKQHLTPMKEDNSTLADYCNFANFLTLNSKLVLFPGGGGAALTTCQAGAAAQHFLS